MMNRKIVYYAFHIAVLMLAACSDTEREKEYASTPVGFSSMVVDNGLTRVSGGNWESGDQIGVFALKPGTSLTDDHIVNNYANVPFTTTGDGRFTALADQIYLPQDGSAIDFIAYYPHTAAVNDYIWQVMLTDQSELSKIDLLYSNNLKNVSKDHSAAQLIFTRPLSKLRLNIKAANGSSLSALSATIGGVYTKAAFSLADATLSIDNTSAATVTPHISGSNLQKTVEAILLPTQSGNTVKVVISAGGSNYTWTVPDQLLEGRVYTYDLTLDGTTPEPGATQVYGYTEIPAYKGVLPHAVAALHMVKNASWLNGGASAETRNYAIMYDTEYRLPLWVSHPLHPAYMGSASRTGKWQYDPLIAQSDQPYLKKSWPADGLDRGHMLPSADRNSSIGINETTFYYTNMVAQNSNMNQGKWANLEKQVRTWAKSAAYDTLFVVTGVILPRSPEVISYTLDNAGAESAIPKYMYKVLAQKKQNSNTYRTIGIKMENIQNPPDYTQCLVSVASLEAETGFVFFPSLTDEVKQNDNLNDW